MKKGFKQKRFKKLRLARKYAKKSGGKVYNYQPGYTNKRLGHLIVK